MLNNTELDEYIQDLKNTVGIAANYGAVIEIDCAKFPFNRSDLVMHHCICGFDHESSIVNFLNTDEGSGYHEEQLNSESIRVLYQASF